MRKEQEAWEVKMNVVIYDAIREAGIDEKPAKNLAVAINDALEQSIDLKQLATKADLQVEIEKVRLEIEKSKSNIIKWVVGAMFTAVGLATAIALTIARLFFTAG